MVEVNQYDTSMYDTYQNVYESPQDDDDKQSQVVIGISVGIAVISLLAMFLLTLNILSKNKTNNAVSIHRKYGPNNQISIRSSHFKIVPISRSNLKSSRMQPAIDGSFAGQTLTSCFQNDAKNTSIQSSEFSDCTEFDYYDFANNRVPMESYYGNGGTVVHV